MSILKPNKQDFNIYLSRSEIKTIIYALGKIEDEELYPNEATELKFDLEQVLEGKL